MRYLIIASTVFVLCGVILVAGSLFKESYTVMEKVRADRAKTWVDDTYVLMPFENRTYKMDSVIKNTSIFQIDLQLSAKALFKIINDDENTLVFEWPKGGTFFWTPPPLGYDIWLFVIDNPSSAQVNVNAKITEYFLKTTEYRDVTYYRSVLDPFYGYNGIIAIILGTALNIVYVSKKKDEST